jgi:hypothetical protein
MLCQGIQDAGTHHKAAAIAKSRNTAHHQPRRSSAERRTTGALLRWEKDSFTPWLT